MHGCQGRHKKGVAVWIPWIPPEADLLNEERNQALEIKHNLQDCLYLAAAAGCYRDVCAGG
jgi:hypothetical protein